MTVLNLAYSGTVTGDIQFNVFFDILTEQNRTLVKMCKSDRTFCFGGGIEVKFTKLLNFP